MPGRAQVKNKIKRVDRLPGNESFHRDIPLIFKSLIAMLTNRLSLCVIAADWSGYPSQEYHVLRASLICDGRSVPLLSHIAPSGKQNNSSAQQAFLNALAGTISPGIKVVIITDAGFKNAWFRHIKLPGWDFTGRIRDTVKFRLQKTGECWYDVPDIKAERHPVIKAGSHAVHPGAGTPGRTEYARCDGHFIFTKSHRDASKAAKEPWLIFSSKDF